MRYAVRACILRHNFDQYMDELIDICKDADIDEVMMCEDNIFISAISQPLEAHREMAELLKEAVRRCKAAGLKCTFYLKSLIGHFTCKTYVLPYTKFIGMNGEESVNECCLLDEGFAHYAAELMSYYAGCGFEKIMLDDDIRSLNHCNGQDGCFCHLHTEAVSRELGRPVTKEELIHAFRNFDDESLAIKKAYRKVNFEGQLRFVRAVEQAVHQVDPDVQLGQMASGVEADQHQGRDMLLYLQTLAGEKHRPFLRPPGGYYSETLGDALLQGMSSGLKYKKTLGDQVDYVSEVEVYSPRNVFTKSCRMLDLQMQTHALTGFDYLSLNVFDHFGSPPEDNQEYTQLLKTRKSHYEKLYNSVQGKEPWGVGLPLPENYVENLRDLRFGAQGVNSYGYMLQRLGVPVCYGKTQVNFLTEPLLNCYSDEQVLELLKGGVIFDQHGLKAALDRGFGRYIGAEITGQVDVACYEQTTFDPMNGRFTERRYPAYTANVHANELTYLLKAQPDARVLTQIVDADFKVLGAGTVYFENELGGKVLSLGTAFTTNNLLHKGRRCQFQSAVKAMFGDQMPYELGEAVFVAPLWYKGEEKDLLALYNFSFDEQSFTLTARGIEQNVTLEPLSISTIEV